MKKPTRQQAFDIVARHLFKQGRMSMDLRGGDEVMGSCRYRGTDDCRCAIGALIPDDLYDPGMEGAMADTLLNKFPQVRVVLPLDTRFLIELQQTHDWESNWLSTGAMHRALERVALAHKLKPTILHTLSFADR